MAEAETSEIGGPPGAGALFAWMLVLVLVGAPLIYVLWEALNSLLSGHPGEIRIGLVLPVLTIFVLFVLFLARLVRRWDASRESR